MRRFQKYIHKATDRHYEGSASLFDRSRALVSRRGGGAVVTIPVADLEPVSEWPEPRLSLARFDLESGFDDVNELPLGLHDQRDRWNGWARPFFRRDAIELYAFFEQNFLSPGDDRPTEYDGIDLYEWRGDDLWALGAEGDPDSIVPTISYGGDVWFGIGDGWCWDSYALDYRCDDDDDD